MKWILTIGGLLCILIITFVVVYQQPAVQTQEEVVSSIPPEGLSKFELGQYYFNHDEDPGGPYDLEQARFHYEQALAEDHLQNNQLWYQLGRIDFIEGKFDDALMKFAIQEKLYGKTLPNVYYMIGLTHGFKARREGVNESWTVAEENFSKFIALAPKAPWSRVDLAWIYFSQGKYEEMKLVLEVGLEYEPDNAWLLNMYGLAIFNTAANKEDARSYFERAKALADAMEPVEWGKTYPGNNPADWPAGLAEFKALIAANVALLD